MPGAGGGIRCQQHFQCTLVPTQLFYSCRAQAVWKRSETLPTVLILRMHGSISSLRFKCDSSFSVVNTFPALSISIPAFYSQGFQPHLLTRNEMWPKYSGNIRCYIQINEIHTAFKFYPQVQRK